MKKNTVFFCTECGNESAKWMGKCLACGSWNTMTEQPKPEPRRHAAAGGTFQRESKVLSLDNISLSEEVRFSTGLAEFDRVLGGGAVTGSLILVSGEPGIGKSTLLLQICRDVTRMLKVLYVSGEESPRQIKLRADRLGVGKLDILPETDLDAIFDITKKENPDVIIIDSIQTMQKQDIASAPGNVGQVKDCTLALMQLAKNTGVTIFIIGHVNKEGSIAGPKVLEHMVDCVLYFEGERHMSYRILRASKNRFGSTHEIGVFEMMEDGLREIPNPSELMLSGRPLMASGTCVACIMEGSRPVLAEIQALVTTTSFGVPRRTVSGFDYNRAMLLMAVLEKRGGFFFGNMDAYLNVVGGLRMLEPACDLPCLLALASSFKNIPIRAEFAAFGEVGLTGELRSVQSVRQRLAECARLGFTSCVIPAHGTKSIPIPQGLQVHRAKHISDAIRLLSIKTE